MPIAVLSPAKTLDESVIKGLQSSEPSWSSAEQEELLGVCKKLSKGDIKKLMGLSDALATLNFDRYQNFEQQLPKASCWSFDGPAHKALDISSLSETSQQYAEQHILTLSGLYGCLSPLNGVRPYRLEMGTKLVTAHGKSLYEFWGDKVAQQIATRLKEVPASERFVVNVASEEYWQVVGKHATAVFGDDIAVYTIKFPGPSVYAKQARGLYCRFLCEAAVLTADRLQEFGEWTKQQSGPTYSRSDKGANSLILEFSRCADASASVKSTKRSNTTTAKSASKRSRK